MALSVGRHHHPHLACRRGPAASAPSRKLLVRAAATPPPAAVHNGRLPFLQTLQQFVQPKDFANKVLQGHKFAWGKTGLLPSRDTLFIADGEAARNLMAAEMQLGVRGDWPETFRGMMGHSSISMTEDLDLHSRLRQYLGMSFTKEAVNNMLPLLQATAATHMARWAAATAHSSHTSDNNNNSSSSSSSVTPAVGLATTAGGSMVLGYPAVRMLTFDVLVNQVLGLQMSDSEVQQYAGLFQTLVDGFVPPAWDLPFTPYGKGLKARQQITERILATMQSPQCSGALARLRDGFGADSPVTVDNTITLLFAGFDTTSSSLTYMLYLLAQHPEVVQKVHAEQAAVVSKHGPTLTPEAYSSSMPYTMAVIKETLRLSQIIAYVPRLATKDTPVPSGPTVPAGCPFLIALAAISAADPALEGPEGVQQFKPERWLDPAAAKSLSQYQLPFGTGQRTCLGINLAYAEMAAVLAELCRSYTLSAHTDTEWKDFPIKRRDNALPLRLTPRAAGNAVSTTAAAAQAASLTAGRGV